MKSFTQGGEAGVRLMICNIHGPCKHLHVETKGDQLFVISDIFVTHISLTMIPI